MRTKPSLTLSACLVALCSPLATSVWANDTVTVPDLVVKERLQALEQINVTAFKPAQAIAPSTPTVEALLKDAFLEDEYVEDETLEMQREEKPSSRKASK